MNQSKLLYGEITEKIIGAAFEIHNTLGPNLSEKIYQTALAIKLREIGLVVEEERVLSMFMSEERVGEQRVDLLVEDKVIVETKAIRTLTDDSSRKLIACLRNTKYEVGLLINFKLKVEFKRLIYSAENK